ncbi:MAG: four helix bundle protein [Bacteroidetes bacterium RIFOXYA12_FULL_35_11]|nr:MAG: four helix bundle protein [Bacteroidetes bacterium GWF2_35_48]OFY78134.1 MAG: four helix bundle protein [Bacteroidetes bacterium RIFOXYA12_FULL_35_11]OFY92589.1 MAG: four helix bundle protein [Bacteroidetes bacterium RIFOXYC12_FULL_35_7]OFY94691.1 MAG: four helix bundle protein [Bacteroidetes bacterium RIFOXYB2_FULL_35_7]HBX52890.1 four helix bundle protein [Bacteroidales bacterium]
MKLEDLEIYNLSMVLGEKVWSIVINWNYLAIDTIGKQVIRSADSVAANISEGYGRFHSKDTKNFLFYSRGSLSETKTWLTKAYNRNLIIKEEYLTIVSEINNIGVKLNNYIKVISRNIK